MKKLGLLSVLVAAVLLFSACGAARSESSKDSANSYYAGDFFYSSSNEMIDEVTSKSDYEIDALNVLVLRDSSR